MQATKSVVQAECVPVAVLLELGIWLMFHSVAVLCKLMVCNIPADAEEEYFVDMCQKHGRLADCCVNMSKNNDSKQGRTNDS